MSAEPEQPEQPVEDLAPEEVVQDRPYHADKVAEEVRRRFVAFLNEFVLPEPTTAPHSETSQSSQPQERKFYVMQAEALREDEKTTMFVDFHHLYTYDQSLADAIESHFYRMEPYLREGLRTFIAMQGEAFCFEGEGSTRRPKPFYLGFTNYPQVKKLRDLKADRLAALTCFSATVTRTSEVRPELISGTFRCADCDSIIRDVRQQFKYTEPLACSNPACNNKSQFILDQDNSDFVDWQKVRVQENSDEIPAGAMPRSFDVILRNELVEQARAGDKIVVTGTMLVVPDVAQLMRPGAAKEIRSGGGAALKAEGVSGLKALGVRDVTYKSIFMASSVVPADRRFGDVNIRDESEDDAKEAYTEAEEEELDRIRDQARRYGGPGGLYQGLAQSIAPGVLGHDDIKKGVLLMLFGGLHKNTPDGIKLRGDINVCVVGDPSTAKSQFLKYVTSFVPRSVYTSGKSSSAAGLTAAVVRDEDTGEFCIEAGALMLADHGICCIDEFEKMDPMDQTAIHEAMEQQTISIAKAGIKASLNARTSILAAANPMGGRYDRSKPLRANVDISPPIMSRFDLFFIVVDECDEHNDVLLAKHIVALHKDGMPLETVRVSKQDLQKYIRLSRRIRPVISPEAKEVLKQSYRDLRQQDAVGTARGAYRFTVRQLESMIRLSEAYARMLGKDEIEAVHVEEARRLLERSVIRLDAQPIMVYPEAQDEDLDMSAPADSAEPANENGTANGHQPNGTADGDTSMQDNQSASEETRKSPRKKTAKGKDESPKKGRGRGRGARGSKESEEAKEGDSAGSADGDDGGAERGEGDVDMQASEEIPVPSSDTQSAAATQPSEKPQQAPQPAPVEISREEYDSIARAVVMQIWRAEQSVEADDSFGGMKILNLVEWYIEENKDNITTETFRAEVGKISGILRRMLEDNTLVDVTPEKEGVEVRFRERMVAIHPNHPIDDY